MVLCLKCQNLNLQLSKKGLLFEPKILRLSLLGSCKGVEPVSEIS